MPERIVPTDADGVEDRFPARESPTTVYNRARCPICGVPWVHPEGEPMKEVLRPDGDKDLIPQDHEHLSPGCPGKRPAPTLFDTAPERKGAYS